MITVNYEHMNMATLAGLCDGYIRNHDIPIELYVFGLGNDGVDFYIDTRTPKCKEITMFLANNGVRVQLGLPNNPNQRPALGVSRTARQNEIIDFSARIACFVLFSAYYDVVFPPMPVILQQIDVENDHRQFNQALRRLMEVGNNAILRPLITNDNDIGMVARVGNAPAGGEEGLIRALRALGDNAQVRPYNDFDGLLEDDDLDEDD